LKQYNSATAVSVAEIAGEAAVNKAAIYQYFQSKEQLAYAVQKDNHKKQLPWYLKRSSLRPRIPYSGCAQFIKTFTRFKTPFRKTVANAENARSSVWQQSWVKKMSIFDNLQRPRSQASASFTA